MTKIVKASADEVFSIMILRFDRGQNTWILVSGYSMAPLLKGDRDSVELTKATLSEVQKGDIVLIKRDNGDYVLHRCHKIECGKMFLNGDAQQWIEGPVDETKLIARVVKIQRNGIMFTPDNLKYKIYVKLWVLVMPFRIFIFKVIRKAKKIIG